MTLIAVQNFNMRSSTSVASSLLFLAFTLCCQSAILAEAPRMEITDKVPALSLESLYHPKERFKYVTSPTPFYKWVETSGSPMLLVRQGDGWRTIDLATGEAGAAHHLFELLPAKIQSLGGIEQKEAASLAQSWISMTDASLAPRLMRIGESLAIIGLQPEHGYRPVASWVTRAAGAWREPTLSPDGNQIAYVEANDLFVMQLKSGKVTRITHDGSATTLNGILDWVYQEEIYGRGNFRAFWWSPDSTAIAFLKLNTADVAEFTVTGSNSPRGETLIERYPKSGDPITQAQLWVVHVGHEKEPDTAEPVRLLEDKIGHDVLVTRVGWNSQTNDLWAQISNRLQNDMSLIKITKNQWNEYHEIIREQCDKWLEVHELPRVLKSGELLRLSDLLSGRRRLWRLSADGKERRPITPEQFDVRDIVYVDSEDRYVLVTGDRLRGTVGQQLYRFDLQTPSKPQRLSDEAAWHGVSVSKNGEWMVDSASSVAEPTTTWLRSLVDQDSPPHVLHQERIQLPETPLEITWPNVTTKDGIKLPAYVIRPKTEADQRLPVLIETYGGPLAPSVRDSWSSGRYLFHQMLAREGIAVMVVDNRSSGGRGLADSWSIHERMGEVETNDLVAVADWLAGQDWADAKRLAVRGWSFGGFLTLHAMTHSDRFAAGIAGGSVTDWRNYDAIYTERYMGLPKDNPRGYDSTSPILAADKIHGRVLMLHGEVDDNVHLANAMQMAAALQRAGKLFDLMIYPGSAHAVHSPDQNYHLMRTTMEFLRREFKLPPK
jgi:dipeptidyl-peptidase 4